MVEDIIARARLSDIFWECETLGEWPTYGGKETRSRQWLDAYEYVVLWAMEEPFVIDEAHLRELRHRLTGSNDFYRTEQVYINGYDKELPQPAEIQKLMVQFYQKMERLLKIEEPVRTAATAHLDLVAIHPFDRDNGKTARLIMNAVLLNGGHYSLLINGSWRKEYDTALKGLLPGDDGERFIRLISHKVKENDGGRNGGT